MDVLCVSHGDSDHCGGFGELLREVKAGRLGIGSIWTPTMIVPRCPTARIFRPTT